MERIILIDLSAIFWRYWHVSESKEFSTARTDTVTMVEDLIQEFDYCAVCIDAAPYKRTQMYPEYKAGRERKPIAVEELREAIKAIKAHGVPCYWSDGYEADDIIAALSNQSKGFGLNVTVAGCDKDLLQIEGVTIYDPFQKKVLTAEEKFGVPAGIVSEVLALMGDTADNIPGLPGVGPKKAASIVTVCSVSSLIAGTYDKDEFSKFPESVKKAITENIEQLKLSYSLVLLDYDAPVNLNLEHAKKKPEEAGEAMQETEETVEDVKADEKVEPPSVQPRNTEIAIRTDNRNANWSLALEPQTMNDAVRVAQMLHKSRLFGQFKNPESVMAILLRGRELGIGATTALSSFHVIKDRPTMHASLIVGLVLQSGLAEYFDLVESTDEKATWATKRKTGKREVVMTFTVEDATNAKLMTNDSNSNWNKYRKTMLRWRAATELSRAVYPDVTTGLYTPDEIETGSVGNDF